MIESKYLKDNVQNIQRLLTIPGLKDFETRNLAKLLRLSKIREYEDGELIIKEGEEDPWLYFLLSGKIVIKKNNVEIAKIDTVGEIFGEMRIVDLQNRSASVYAKGRTLCLGVDTSAKGRLETASVEERDARLDFLLLLYRIFSEYMSIRLRATNDELVKAKTENEKLKEMMKK